MQLTVRLLGLELLDLHITTEDDTADVDERLTFGFASTVGTAEISDERSLDWTDG